MMIETTFHLLSSGAEVYIVQSSNYKSSIVANNSVIVHQQDPCVNCKADIYCYSNSTLSNIGEIIFPNGKTYSTNSGLNHHYTVDRLQSAIHVAVPNSDSSLGLNQGIYTCKIPDSNGISIDISFGLYSDYPG